MASSLVMLTSTLSASRALMVRLSQRGAADVMPVFSPTASLIACARRRLAFSASAVEGLLEMMRENQRWESHHDHTALGRPQARSSDDIWNAAAQR